MCEDRQPPNVNPVNPPDGFTPGTLPYNLDPLLNTLTVTWPIDGSDSDAASVIFDCTIAGASVYPDSQSVDGDLFSATFSYDFGVGTTPVSCNVTDGNGNTATVTFDVEVFDVTGPLITVPYQGGPSLEVEGSSVDGTASPDLESFVLVEDNVAVASLSCSAMSDPLQYGPNPVSCTATDTSGNSTTEEFVVTVLDVFPPAVTVNDPIENIELTDTGEIPAGVVLENYVTAGDNVGIASLICSPVNGPLIFGPNQVSCTATDLVGLSTTVTYTVTVVDVTPPELSVLLDTVSIDTDPITGDIPNFDLASNVSATDNVDLDVTISCTLDNPPLSIGSNPVTCTGTDDSGNTSEPPVYYTINVVDKTPPIINVSDRTVYRNYVDDLYPFWGSIDSVELKMGVTATDGSVSITDISCTRDDPPEQIELPANPTAPAPPILTDNDFEFSDVPYSITCSAKDSAQNLGTASYLLTVRYLYDITLELPKGAARAGSTIPIDFSYSEWIGGAPVDGSEIPVRVSWAKFEDEDCLTRDLSTAEDSSGLGEDSGNSDFRYSASSDTWQFSWQTPDLEGYYRLAISPPGKLVETARRCVILR